MFIGNSQKESRYLASPVYCEHWSGYSTVASGGYKTDFNSDSVSSISSVKNSPAKAIKISAVILNLASDKPDSDKNRKR